MIACLLILGMTMTTPRVVILPERNDASYEMAKSIQVGIERNVTIVDRMKLPILKDENTLRGSVLANIGVDYVIFVDYRPSPDYYESRQDLVGTGVFGSQNDAVLMVEVMKSSSAEIIKTIHVNKTRRKSGLQNTFNMAFNILGTNGSFESDMEKIHTSLADEASTEIRAIVGTNINDGNSPKDEYPSVAIIPQYTRGGSNYYTETQKNEVNNWVVKAVSEFLQARLMGVSIVSRRKLPQLQKESVLNNTALANLGADYLIFVESVLTTKPVAGNSHVDLGIRCQIDMTVTAIRTSDAEIVKTVKLTWRHTKHEITDVVNLPGDFMGLPKMKSDSFESAAESLAKEACRKIQEVF